MHNVAPWSVTTRGHARTTNTYCSNERSRAIHILWAYSTSFPPFSPYPTPSSPPSYRSSSSITQSLSLSSSSSTLSTSAYDPEDEQEKDEAQDDDEEAADEDGDDQGGGEDDDDDDEGGGEDDDDEGDDADDDDDEISKDAASWSLQSASLSELVSSASNSARTFSCRAAFSLLSAKNVWNALLLMLSNGHNR
jgi:hypothetical protein